MMSKQERLDELKKIKFPNDEEVEEILRLEEELNLTKVESCKEEIPKPQKRSILDIIRTKLKKKPITYQEIERLKNERIVAYLKRDIAKANYERKNPGDKRSGSRKKSPLIPKLFEEYDGKDLRKISGTNDPKKYKGLIP